MCSFRNVLISSHMLVNCSVRLFISLHFPTFPLVSEKVHDLQMIASMSSDFSCLRQRFPKRSNSCDSHKDFRRCAPFCTSRFKLITKCLNPAQMTILSVVVISVANMEKKFIQAAEVTGWKIWNDVLSLVLDPIEKGHQNIIKICGKKIFQNSFFQKKFLFFLTYLM